MSVDVARYKPELRRFLALRGVEIDDHQHPPRLRCLSPAGHKNSDQHPSAVLYPEVIYCPVCQTKDDIFAAAGKLAGLATFTEQAALVARTLGDSDLHGGNGSAHKKPTRGASPALTRLSVEAARAIYRPEQLLELARRQHWGTDVAGAWPILNEAGEVEAADVRFEGAEDGRKRVITVYYDGEHLRTKTPPVLLYGRDQLSLHPDDPAAAHEGCKCAAAAGVIPGFVHIAWTGGSGKVDLVDIAPLAGRDVILYPDDDEPGMVAMARLRDRLLPIARSVVIRAPLEAARAVKARGSDIVEALQVRTPGEMAEYLRNGPQLFTATDSGTKAPDGRPIIVSNNRDLRDLAQEAADALQAANDSLEVYRRGSELVQISGGRIEPVSEWRLRHLLARAAAFMEKTGKGLLIPCVPPIEVVRDILATPSLPFPEIVRVVHGPFIGADGELLAEIGYHAGAKAYIDQAIEVADFPGTGPEAAEWVLCEVYGDFPFAAQADRANALGGMISCIGRDLIPRGVPLHGAEAAVHGTGKGLLVDATAMSAFGENGVELVAYSESDEETRKRITSSLRGAPGALKLDNVRNGIDSASLSALLTTQVWADRLLGRNEIITLAVRAVVFSTANNPPLSGEIARRYIPIRLTASVEQPWTRTGFRHPELLEWCREHRGQIIGAVARMIRHWIVSGRPSWSGTPLGSFEPWSRIVGGILECCGVSGFMANHSSIFEAADVEAEAWRALVGKWQEQYADLPVGVADLFVLAQAIDGFPLRGATDRAQRTSFGSKLARQRDRVYGDQKVIREPGSMHGARYRLVRGTFQPCGTSVGLLTREKAETLFDAENAYRPGCHNLPGGCEVPTDLAALSPAERRALGFRLSEALKSHPELKPDYDRLVALIAADDGGTP